MAVGPVGQEPARKMQKNKRSEKPCIVEHIHKTYGHTGLRHALVFYFKIM